MSQKNHQKNKFTISGLEFIMQVFTPTLEYFFRSHTSQITTSALSRASLQFVLAVPTAWKPVPAASAQLNTSSCLLSPWLPALLTRDMASSPLFTATSEDISPRRYLSQQKKDVTVHYRIEHSHISFLINEYMSRPLQFYCWSYLGSKYWWW